MRYLVDTDIVIDYLRGKKNLDKKTIEIIESGVSLSIISLGELTYGAYKSSNPNSSLATIQGFINDLSVNVIEINHKVISIFGQTKAELEILGTRLEDFDLLIAATAKELELTLVTRNVKHFGRIKGLKLLE